MSRGAAICAHCGYDLKVFPQRRRKCPSCKVVIFVKSTPQDRRRQLVTEREAQEIEAQWAAYHERQESLRLLQPFGFTEPDIENEIGKGESRKSDSQTVFSLLERVTYNSGDLHAQKMAFYEMALIAEKQGKPFRGFLAEAARRELLRYKQHNVKRVEILTAGPGNACAQCEAQAHKIFDIDDAVRLTPIPCPACTGTLVGSIPGFCRCSYVADLESLGI